MLVNIASVFYVFKEHSISQLLSKKAIIRIVWQLFTIMTYCLKIIWLSGKELCLTQMQSFPSIMFHSPEDELIL